MNGKTGIEIQVGLAPGARKIGEAFHALHLDSVLKWFAHHTNVVITIDGVEHREPLYQAHFVEAAPGSHDVSIYADSPTLVTDDARKAAVTGTRKNVVVEPGMVAVLEYTPKDTGGALLDVLASRPA